MRQSSICTNRDRTTSILQWWCHWTPYTLATSSTSCSSSATSSPTGSPSENQSFSPKISNSDTSAFNKNHRTLSLKSKEFHPNSPNLHPTKEEKYSKKSGNEEKKKYNITSQNWLQNLSVEKYLEFQDKRKWCKPDSWYQKKSKWYTGKESRDRFCQKNKWG